jgi:signal transduction histidine kinase
MVTNVSSGRVNDAFLSWLNHELRSPLNACVMWLDVLALAPQPEKLAQAVQAIKRNLARQTRLVNDLNDAAKVSADRLELRFEPLDLVALLRRNLPVWEPLARAKQLTFQLDLELETAPLEGDPERLQQSLNHLLESAINSTPAAGRVALRLHAADAHYVVEVTDTGERLSAEDVANLAAPLWRSPASAKARSGLGLGLAIAHYVAVKHGGSLAAASDAGGTRFVLTLPVAAAKRSIASVAPPQRG